MGSGAASRPAHRPSKVRLSRLRVDRPGAGLGASDCRRRGDAGAARAGADRQVLRSHALYRQSQIFARHSVDLARSTLVGWVGGACWWLEALHERLCKNVFASNHLFADDKPFRCSIPAAGARKRADFAREQRPWCGPEPPAAAFLLAPDRKAERPASHLGRFKGVLHVDGYTVFERLAADGDVVLAACWAHTRRKFYQVLEATGSPVAAEALRRIGELYAVEARVRGQSPARRLAERQSFSRSIAEALRDWLEAQLPRVSGAARSPKRSVMRFPVGTD